MEEDGTVYDFGLRLRQLRESGGLSRAALAKKLDVSKETIYRYENNLQAPSLERARQIAVLLRTSLDYLTGLDNAYTVRLPNLTPRQREALDEFLKAFAE